MSSRRSPDKPVCFFGRIVFEFYNNSDEDFKAKTLRSLAKEARKELNISCLPVEEHEVVNPERGALVLAVTGVNHDSGKALLDKALAYFDQHAPARIVLDEFEKAEIA